MFSPKEVESKECLQVVIGTTSPRKVAATKAAFKESAVVTGKEVESGVPMQPDGYEETLKGAKNRAEKALALDKNVDIVIGIESGLMEDGCDQAVIYCLTRADNFTTPQIYLSDKVQFDKESIVLARARGFDKCTVGMILAERGLVKNHKDPHICLTGISRKTYLTKTLSSLVSAIFADKEPPRITL